MDAVSYANGGVIEALNAKVYGNGSQTLVLSHGYGCDQNVWHYVLPFLACYFKVVVFNLAFSANVRDHVFDAKRYSSYYSYATDLENLLDELHLNNTIFLGHSMSAMIGCIAATQRPDLFKHLILLNGSPRYLDEKGYNGGFKESDVEAVFKDIKQDLDGWATSFATATIGVNNTNAIREYKAGIMKMGPEVSLEVAKTVFSSDYRFVLRKVKVPCTIIQSKKDYDVPLSIPFYMEKLLPGSSTRVEILKTDGHVPQLTTHALLQQVIRRVVSSLH